MEKVRKWEVERKRVLGFYEVKKSGNGKRVERKEKILLFCEVKEIK